MKKIIKPSGYGFFFNKKHTSPLCYVFVTEWKEPDKDFQD